MKSYCIDFNSQGSGFDLALYLERQQVELPLSELLMTITIMKPGTAANAVFHH